jgi:hypothetical protein
MQDIGQFFEYLGHAMIQAAWRAGRRRN